MKRKRHADLPLEGGRSFLAKATCMRQIGDLEGETLAAVRAACQRCHLPLPATCLAYSLFQAASRSDAKQLCTTKVSEAAIHMQAIKDREAEQMQTEICSKLGTHPGGDKEGRHAGTSRFVALAELHATSAGQKSAARRAARFYFFTLQDSGVEWWS